MSFFGCEKSRSSSCVNFSDICLGNMIEIHDFISLLVIAAPSDDEANDPLCLNLGKLPTFKMISRAPPLLAAFEFYLDSSLRLLIITSTSGKRYINAAAASVTNDATSCS